MPPTFPKPCTTHRCSASGQSSRSHARATTITTPAPVASRRKTEPPIEIGLPVTISGHGVAALHRVRVHHPGHRLLVRGHVRRRDVLLGPDERQELRREPPRQPLELVDGHRVRVAAHPALRTSVGKPQQRALPRHPHRERRTLAERHLDVVAQAALRRAHDARVLNAVAREDDAPPFVQTDRDADDDRALGIAQALGDLVRDPRVRDGLVELGDRRAVQRRVPLELGMGKRFGSARHGGRSVPGNPPAICASRLLAESRKGAG